MRTAVIIVFVLVAATPAHASKSCMTMPEARQQFATTHLYWHGAGHCWDGTPPRHRVVRVKPRENRRARLDDHERTSQEPKWRNAMSEMLPTDARIETPIETPPGATIVAADEQPSIDWSDRWVEVVQATAPVIFNRMDKPADTSPIAGGMAGIAVTPVRLMLMFLVLTLAALGLLFRNLLHDRRR